MIVKTSFIRAPYDAVTVWPFIFVRPSQVSNKALITHEMVHYRSQAWVTPFWLLRYWLSKSFRWKQEVEGYKAQIADNGITVENAASLLTTYGTGHTLYEARTALTPNG